MGRRVANLEAFAGLPALKVLILDGDHSDEEREKLEQQRGDREIHYQDGSSIGGVCDIDPEACPDGCEERRRLLHLKR